MQSKTLSFIPRQWQADMLATFSDWYANRQSGGSKTFVAGVTGGAGKTYAGAMIAKMLDSYKLLILAPSNVIASQWLGSLAEQGIQAVLWESDKEYHVASAFITTYKMMELHRGKLAKLGRYSLVIFDEFHHLAESRTWGTAANTISKNAHVRLLLTGTAFREDDAAIPLVKYQFGKLVTHFEYNYGQALEDGYVSPIFFRALDAKTHWRYDENERQSNFGDTSTWSETMRTVLNPKGNWLKALIKSANDQLDRLRLTMPNAGGIIRCIDQNHARQVQRLIQQITHTNPVLAISDDEDSDAKINHFRDSNEHWLVVVGKGSEGLDIPRLRVGVWASNVTKQLSFMQFLWRVVRGNQDAFFFMPAHPLLLEYAKTIRDMRIHTLTPELENSSEGESRSNGNRSETSHEFEAISSEVTETHELVVSVDGIHNPLALLRKIAEHANRAMFNIASDCSAGNAEASQVYAANQLKQIAALLPQVTPVDKPVLEIASRAEERKSAHETRVINHQKRLWATVLNRVRNLSPLNQDALMVMLYDTSRAWNRDDIATILACNSGSIKIGLLVNTDLVRAETYPSGYYRSNLEKHIQLYPHLPNHDFLSDIAAIVEKK